MYTALRHGGYKNTDCYKCTETFAEQPGLDVCGAVCPRWYYLIQVHHTDEGIFIRYRIVQAFSTFEHKRSNKLIWPPGKDPIGTKNWFLGLLVLSPLGLIVSHRARG